MYILGSEGFVESNIVRAIKQDDVNDSHPDHQRDDAQCYDLIFSEQHASPDKASSYSHNDDDQGEAGTPPAEEEGGMILLPGARFGRRIAPEG